MSFSASPRSSSRPTSTVASSSEVDSRTVAKRQCSTSEPSRNIPMWVWVLPTSTASSIRRGLSPLHPLVHQPRQFVGQPRAVGELEVGVELEQRFEHEAAGGDLAVRQGQAPALVFEVAEQEQVDVDRARRVPRCVLLPAEVALDLLAYVEELLRAEVGLDLARG